MPDWRGVPGFALYQASDEGLVRRHPDHLHHNSPPVLKNAPTGNGYLALRLMRDGVPIWRSTHSIICETFHGPAPSPKHEVGFRDDERANCRAENVFWRTRTEERAHRRSTGKHREGERVPWSRLRARQIPDIRARLAAGETCKSIGVDLGVSEGAINGIRIGRNWKHVA